MLELRRLDKSIMNARAGRVVDKETAPEGAVSVPNGNVL